MDSKQKLHCVMDFPFSFIWQKILWFKYTRKKRQKFLKKCGDSVVVRKFVMESIY